jgi:hypothetical protein
MTTNNETQSLTVSSFKSTCLTFCQNVVRQLQDAKTRLVSDYRSLVNGQEHALHLALNEAEALAWETDYPHLVFADLAAEKVAALVNWARHQDAIQRGQLARVYA